MRIISETIQRINIFTWRDVKRPLVGEDNKAGFRARRFLDESALNVVDGDFRRVASFGEMRGEFGGELQSLIADI